MTTIKIDKAIVLAAALIVAVSGTADAGYRLRTKLSLGKSVTGYNSVACMSSCTWQEGFTTVISGQCGGANALLTFTGPISDTRPQAWRCVWSDPDPDKLIGGSCAALCAKVESRR